MIAIQEFEQAIYYLIVMKKSQILIGDIDICHVKNTLLQKIALCRGVLFWIEPFDLKIVAIASLSWPPYLSESAIDVCKKSKERVV